MSRWQRRQRTSSDLVMSSLLKTSSAGSFRYITKETYYKAKETYYQAKETYYKAKETYYKATFSASLPAWPVS